jgi:Uma2 family endonuclease
LPLYPDFALELRSPSDRIGAVRAKMQEYIDNGVRLAWLVDPKHRRVYVYRPGVEELVLENPETVSGNPELPGFTLDLSRIWDPGF